MQLLTRQDGKAMLAEFARMYSSQFNGLDKYQSGL